MSYIELLPYEVLLKIFGYLTAHDILTCSNVCQRWLNVVQDYFNDIYWKRACIEFGCVYKNAYDKADLTWCELAQSFSLWSKLEEAEVTVRKVPKIYGDIKYRQILIRNGVLSRHRVERIYQYDRPPTHSLVYYNMDSMEEIHMHVFPFPFTHYDVNKYFLALQYDDKLYIRPKKNGKLGRKRVIELSGFDKSWWLIDKECYIYRSNTLRLNSEVVVEHIDELLDVSKDGENKLILFTKGHQGYCVLRFNNKILETVHNENKIKDFQTLLETNKLLGKVDLKYHINNLQNPKIDRDIEVIKKYGSGHMNNVIFYGRVVLWLEVSRPVISLNARRNVILAITYNPNRKELSPSVVCKKVDVNLTIRSVEELSNVFLDVVETKAGHTIVVANTDEMRFVTICGGQQRTQGFWPQIRQWIRNRND